MREVLRSARIGEFVATEVEYAPGVLLESHAHETARFNLVLRGRFEERCEGHHVQCERGSATFRPAAARHTNRFLDRTRCLTIETSHGVAATLPRVQSAIAGARVADIGEQLRRELACGDASSTWITHGLVLQLAGLLARGAAEPREPEWLRGVREHLTRNAAAQHSLRALARQFEVNPSYLATAFRQHFGCTVGAFLRQQRAELAAELLRGTRAPLAAVAAEAGFADQSHMTRVFRAALGCTPRQFRRRERESKK
ncbi:MAG TPA: AraC family transcriptional regulator [Thermoanaerobaculia bacterium]|jgi:AraC family transcriptional regulator